jgi:hypothetical protein
MDKSRKNLTITISVNSYYRARVWAAHHSISVSALVSAFLSTVDLSKTALKCIDYTGTQEELVRRIEEGE